MKRNIIHTALCALGLVALGSANAGTFTTNSPSGQPGSTVTYTVSFAGDGETEDAQLDASFPAASFSAVVANPALVPGSTCTVPGGNSIRVVPPSGGGVALTSTATAYCSFQVTINAAVVPPATLNFTQTFIECADSVAPPPATCTATLGAVNGVNITPEFNVNPAIANPLAFSGGVATNIDQTITVENIGDPGTNLTLTGTVTGPVFSIVSGLPNNAPGIATGANANIVLRCNSAAPGTFTDTLVLTTNDPDDGEGTVNIPLTCTTNLGPTAPTASLGAVVQPTAGVINQVATGSVPVNVVTGGTPVASLALTCTIPATGTSNFLVTSGGTRTIVAPATVGPNAPDIGVSCVRQAAAVSATLTCTQNATPDPDPAALTATIDCPAGITAPNYSSSPAAGGTIAATGVQGDPATGTLNVSNAGGTAQLDVTCTTASPGFTVTSGTLNLAAGASGAVNFTCTAPGAGASTTGALSCTHNAPNVASPVTYVLACNGVSGVIPAMGNAGKILLVSLVIGLGLLGMGLRRQG